MKVIYILLFIFISCSQKNNDDFAKIMTDLSNLETYIKEYVSEKSYTESSLTHLIVCYIRLGAYTTKEWTIAGGKLPEDLVSYISQKDGEKKTSAQNTQKYRDIIMPNGEKLDFVHMFAVMNGIEFGKSYSSIYAHLVGWGGDTEQLLEDIKNEKGDLDYLMDIAKNNYFRIKGGFDQGDLISDLDAPILLNKKNDNNNFSDLIINYYNSNEYKNRVNEFVKLTFPNLISKNDKESFREEIYKIYSTDTLIQILECEAGMRQSGIIGCYAPGDIKNEYLVHQKAASYVVSDYFFENL